MSPSKRVEVRFDVSGGDAASRDAERVTTAKTGVMVRTLRELRVGQQLSLAELAEKSGINKGTLSGIERGRIVASPAELAAIGTVLGRQLEVRTIAVYEERT